MKTGHTQDPLARRETTVTIALIVAYASFYLCRANVDAAQLPFLGALGYDKTQWGAAMGWVILGHSVGKVSMGALGDRIGGRMLLALCAFASVLLSFSMSFAPSLFVFAILAACNRIFQAGGWSGVVHIAARAFTPKERGAKMGLISISYVAGSPIALLISAQVLEHSSSWRGLFRVNPALLFVIAAFALLVLPKAEASDEVVSATDTGEHPPYRVVLAALLRKPAFWVAIALSTILTFIQTCFVSWTVTYLQELSIKAGEGGAFSASVTKSAIFGVGGVIGALVAGRLSDAFGPGKRAPVMAAFLGAHVAAVLVLAHAPITSSLTAAIVIGVCGLFLQGPYTLLLGAVVLDLGGKRVSSTAVGFIDGAGYLAGAAAPPIIGSLAQTRGWTTAFDLIAVAGALAAITTGLWALRSQTESSM